MNKMKKKKEGKIKVKGKMKAKGKIKAKGEKVSKKISKKISRKVGKKVSKKAKGKEHKIAKRARHHEKSKKAVKKRVIERAPTGIHNFDVLVEGGFKKYSTNIIVGGSGSGKTILATQFLIEGMKKGEKCLYVTFEEGKEPFYANMLKLGWDMEEYEKKGLFMFLEYSPAKVKTMLEEGGGTIENIITEKKIERMVIDSVTSFELLFKDELAKRESALLLFKTIKRWSCTSILTVEEEPSETKDSTSKPLEFESDSIILLYFVRAKNSRQRYLEILKMRGTNHSKSTYKFEIGKGGINMDRRSSSVVLDN